MGNIYNKYMLSFVTWIKVLCNLDPGSRCCVTWMKVWCNLDQGVV